MWFKLTGNTKEIDGQTLKEFVYTEIVDDCRIGDIGGYVYDEECLKSKFSAQNVNIFNGATVESNCKIKNSNLYAGTRINAYFQIYDSELNFAELLSDDEKDKDYDLSFAPKKIIRSKISGAMGTPVVITTNVLSKITIMDSEISFGLKPEGKFGRIFVQKNSVFYMSGKSKIFMSGKNIFVAHRGKLVVKSESLIDNSEIKIVESASSKSCEDPSIKIIKSHIKTAKLNCSSKIEIDDCYIYGTIAAEDNSKGIVLKTTNVYRKSVVQTCEDAKLLTICRSYMQNETFFSCESYAEQTDVDGLTLADKASIRFTFEEHSIVNSEVSGSSRLMDVSLESSIIKGNSKVYSTKLVKSSVSNVNIGICYGHIIDSVLFSNTIFCNLTARGRFEFFIFPVIDNSCYYIFANKRIYRLRKVDAAKTEFEEIDSGLGLEFDFWLKTAKGTDKNSFFSTLTEKDIDIVRKILKHSDSFIEDVFDKRKEDFFKLKRYSEFATYFVLFKLFAIKTQKSLASEDETTAMKKVDDFLSKKIVFDIANKKHILNEENVVFFPKFLLLSLEEEDFRKSFLKQLPKLRENKKIFFI